MLYGIEWNLGVFTGPISKIYKKDKKKRYSQKKTILQTLVHLHTATDCFMALKSTPCTSGMSLPVEILPIHCATLPSTADQWPPPAHAVKALLLCFPRCYFSHFPAHCWFSATAFPRITVCSARRRRLYSRKWSSRGLTGDHLPWPPNQHGKFWCGRCDVCFAVGGRFVIYF